MSEIGSTKNSTLARGVALGSNSTTTQTRATSTRGSAPPGRGAPETLLNKGVNIMLSNEGVNSEHYTMDKHSKQVRNLRDAWFNYSNKLIQLPRESINRGGNANFVPTCERDWIKKFTTFVRENGFPTFEFRYCLCDNDYFTDGITSYQCCKKIHDTFATRENSKIISLLNQLSNSQLGSITTSKKSQKNNHDSRTAAAAERAAAEAGAGRAAPEPTFVSWEDEADHIEQRSQNEIQNITA